MYITINNVTGEKTIDLDYSIENFDSDKEVTIVDVLSGNIQYQVRKPIGGLKSKFYTGREMRVLLEKENMDLLDNNPQIIKINKLSRIVDMIFKLNEINSSNNLEDGRPSNNLFTYHMTGSEDLMHLEPHTPKYKALKNGRLNSLTLRITDQDGNVLTNGPGTTVVLHIRDRKQKWKTIKGTRQKVIVTPVRLTRLSTFCYPVIKCTLLLLK